MNDQVKKLSINNADFNKTPKNKTINKSVSEAGVINISYIVGKESK